MSSKIVRGPGVVLDTWSETSNLRAGYIRICISNNKYRLIFRNGTVDGAIHSIQQYENRLGLVPTRMCTKIEAMMVDLDPSKLNLK